MAKKRLFNEDYIYAEILSQSDEARLFLEKELEKDGENSEVKAKLNSLYRIRNNAFALMMRQGYEVYGVFVVKEDEKKHFLKLDIDGDIYDIDALAIKNILVGDYEEILNSVYNESKSEFSILTLLSLKKPKQPKAQKAPKQQKEIKIQETKKEEVSMEDIASFSPVKENKNSDPVDFDIADAFSDMTAGTSQEKPIYPIPVKQNTEKDNIFKDLMPQFEGNEEEPDNKEQKEEKEEVLEITDDVVEDFTDLTNEINDDNQTTQNKEFSLFEGFNITIAGSETEEVDDAPTEILEKPEEEISFVEIEDKEEEPVVEISAENEPEVSEKIEEEIEEETEDNSLDLFSGFGVSIAGNLEEDEQPKPVKKTSTRIETKTFDNIEEIAEIPVEKEEVEESITEPVVKEEPVKIEEVVETTETKEIKEPETEEEKPIVKIVANKTIKSTMCPNCRAIVNENDTICSSCGFDLTNPEITVEEIMERDKENEVDEDDIRSILAEIKREYEKAKKEEEEAEEKARLEAEKNKKPEFDLSNAPTSYVRDNFKNVKMYRPQESDPEKDKVELLYDVYTIRAYDPKLTEEDIEKKIQNIMETRRLTADQLLRIKEEYENAPRKEREIKVYLFPLHIPANGNERLSQFAAYVIEDDDKIGYFASDFNKPGSLSVTTSTHNFRFLYNWEEGMPKTKFIAGPESENIIDAKMAQVIPSDISRIGFGHPFITLKVEYIDGFESIEIHALPLVEEPRTENGNVRCMFICDDKQEEKRDVLHSDKNSEAIKQFNNKDYKLSCKEEGNLISIKVDVID